jgi:multisubunit Na+/H+ antiporter MnhG subunit
MATEQREMRVDRGLSPRFGGPLREEPPLGELFRQLSEDASRLVRQEVALAKTEVRESARAVGKDATKIGIAAGVGVMGAFAALAFVIIGLGALIGNYWLSALIVAVVLLVTAAVMAKAAMKDIKERELKPVQTMETLRADAQWAKREAQAVKREWKS